MPYGLYDLDEYKKFRLSLYKILKGSDFDAQRYVHETDESILQLVKELKEKYPKLSNGLKILEQQMDQLKKEENKEIYELKAQLGDKKSEWKIRGNSASRWNPDNLKFEPCILPLDFDINKVDIKSFDENEAKMWYDYPNNIEKTKQKQYWIYTELFDFLSNKQKVLEHKKKMKDFKLYEIETWEDIEDYIISKGFSLKGKYMKKMGEFLLKNRGKTFAARDIQKYVKFNNRKTRRDYCLKYIDLGLMKEAKKMGNYKSNL